MKHDLQEKTTRQEAEELAADESEWSRRVAQGPTSRQHSITKAQIEIIIKAAKRTCMSGNKTFIFCLSLFDAHVPRRPRDAPSDYSISLILNQTRKIHLRFCQFLFLNFTVGRKNAKFSLDFRPPSFLTRHQSSHFSISCKIRRGVWAKCLGQPLGESSAFLKHILICSVLLRFESRALQRRMGSKVEAKFPTFWPSVKLGEGWAKCLSQSYEFGLGSN